MTGWKTFSTLIVCLGMGAAARAGEPAALRSLLASRATRGALERIGERVLQRLESDECRRLFSDFADARGRILQENLDALGLTPSEYLRTIVFADGGEHPACRHGRVLALTSPGSRVVFLCPKPFEQAARQNHLHTQAILIHEALHTLGLGENPPASEQITRSVLARCR